MTDKPPKSRQVLPLAVPPVASTAVPPSLNHELIARHRVDSEPDREVDGLAHAVSGLRMQAQALLDLNRQIERDVTRSPAERAVAMAQAAPRIAGRGAEVLDSALAKARDAADALEARIAAPAIVPGPNLDGEIRQHLRSVGLEERRRLISAAIADGDDVITGAVLRAPAIIAGLEPAALEDYRRRWQRKARPAEVGRLERVRAAIRDAEIAGGALVGLAESFVRAPGAVAADRRDAADAALREALR